MTVTPFPSSHITRPVALVPSFDQSRPRLVRLHGGRSQFLTGAARVEQRCGAGRVSSDLSVLPSVSVLNSDRLTVVSGERPGMPNGSAASVVVKESPTELGAASIGKLMCVQFGAIGAGVASTTGARSTEPTRDTVAPVWGVASSDNERRSDVSRPIPLHSDVEGVLIDIEEWRRDAERDGEITPDEAMKAVPMLLVLASLVRLWVATIAHVSTCIQSAKGMFSQRAIRGWNQAHKQCPDNVIHFPERSFDPEVA